MLSVSHEAAHRALAGLKRSTVAPYDRPVPDIEYRYGPGFRAAVIVLTLIYLWLCAGQTLSALGPYGHDDGLFVRLGKYVADGVWLGRRYTELTLAKGPMYPLWIGLTSLLGLPLMASQHLLHAAAALLFVIALRPLRLRPLWATLAFALLVFDPMTYAHDNVRVAREWFCGTLALMVAASGMALIVRASLGARRLWGWAVGLGFALGGFYLTREEGLWLAPLVACTLGAAAWNTLSQDPKARSTALAALAVPLLIAAGMVAAIAAVNHHRYGVYSTVEFRQPDFLDAYGALTRVKHEHWQPTVPVPRDVWRRLYGASPAFAELQPHLDPTRWAPGPTEEIGGGGVMWAFREAVCRAGHCESAATAADYYRRLADEINTACEGNRLECLASSSSMMPPWRDEYLGPLIRALGHALVVLTTYEGFNASPDLSVGPEELLTTFRDLTRDRLSPDAKRLVRARGWLFSEAGPVQVVVRGADGGLADAGVRWLPLDDLGKVKAHLGREAPPAAAESHIYVDTSCSGDCFLAVTTSDALSQRIPLDGTPQAGDLAGLHWNIDDVMVGPPNRIQSRIDALRIGVLAVVGRAYQICTPVLAALAFVALMWWLVLSARRRQLSGLLIAALGAAGAIAARMLILSLVEVTSFAGVALGYMSPAYPVLMVLVILSGVAWQRARGHMEQSTAQRGSTS